MKRLFYAGAKITAGMSLVALFMTPGMASAAESKKIKNELKLEQEADFTAVQINTKVYVFDGEKPIFQTKGTTQYGPLKDLFLLGEGTEHEVPMIVIQNRSKGLMVFSDLWPKFDKDDTYDKNTVDAYDCGRLFTKKQDKIVSKTSHHYAEQKGDEVVVYTANDFEDLKKGYHESYRVEGNLRGLIIYDCCAYGVVEDEDGKLIVYHAGEQGAEKIGMINLQ